MGRQQQFKIELENVEDYVLDLYKVHTPATKISRLLKDEKGLNISPLSINRWLRIQRNADYTEKSVQSKKKFDMIVMDYEYELTSIFNEVKEMKAKAIKDGKLDIYVKLIGKLHEGLNLFAKIKGDLQQKGGNVDINIIFGEINREMLVQNKTLRNRLHTVETIDVEAEIIDEDKKREEKLREQ